MKLAHYGMCGMVLSMLAGCGVIPPKVVYGTYVEPTDASAEQSAPTYLFRHRRSVFLIRNNDDESGKIVVNASPFELTPAGQYAVLMTLQGQDNYRSTTQLKVTYIENTRFIDELGVTTKDNIGDTISKISTLTKAVVPLAASLVSASEKPKADATPIKNTVLDPMVAKDGEWQQDPVNDNLCVRIKGITVETSTKLSDFLKTASRTTFPLPACATATVEVAIVDKKAGCGEGAIAKAEVISARATYAHHENIVALPLPSTGTVKMHGICGASVTEAANEDRYQLLTYLSSIATLAKDAQGAWKDAKDKAEKADKK